MPPALVGPVAAQGCGLGTMQRPTWRHLDLPLLLATLCLVAVGALMIYSSYEATLPPENKPWFENAVYRQLLFAGIGLVLYVLLAALDYHLFVALYRWAYLAALAALVAVLAVGSTSFGAQSWLGVGSFGVQLSELAKFLMIITLARVLGGDEEEMESPRRFLLSMLMVLPPALLIYRQPDFGTALILVATWVGMVFLSGVRWRHLLIAGGVAAAVAPIVWFQLKDYMRLRVLGFFYPQKPDVIALMQEHNMDAYNVVQALISIGSGGWWGKGYLHGTQSQLYFLRVRHTDFIFSVLAEEFGFVGSMMLLALFVLMIVRMIGIAARAPDPEGRLIACGTATMLFSQAFVNLAINVNLLPVTGLPLPLVSYGGSSLVATLMTLGLVQSVAVRQRLPQNGLLNEPVPRPR